MAKSQINLKEIEKLIKLPGEVRGAVFLTDLRYVQEKKGQEGVRMLKKKMRDWGSLISYDKTRPINWYPVGLRAVSLLAIKEVFGWQDKEIFELGNAAPKFSLIVKMLMKTFLSIERVFKECPKYWEKHYTKGVLENYKIDTKKKCIILRLKDFNVHPILCPFYAGYFLRIGQYVLRSQKVSIKETKCSFKGEAPYHEYLITWI